jgi:hypothetical protein
MRSLRYNESFGSISFANVRLDALNGLMDTYGHEHVCLKTKRGTLIDIPEDDMNRACVLVQEIRALAVTSRKLRRLNFTSCITTKSQDFAVGFTGNDIGCGMVEALFPLCRANTTNVDWIVLDNIQLSETDLGYLIEAAVIKACHFRGFGFSNCGLSERKSDLVLDGLRHQYNTLEALDMSHNALPSMFDSQMSAFAQITKLNLNHIVRHSESEALLSAETLLIWRLRELTLSGTRLNEKDVDAIGW